MGTGHWSRLRAKGGGPRGGGGGHAKGPLRKIVRHRKLHTVTGLPRGKGGGELAHWSAWQIILETEDYFQACDRTRAEAEIGNWEHVRHSEGGWEEVLECGHCQMPVHDLIGETNAVRRRCAKCKAGKPPNVPLVE